jgi:hypothetical protein
VEEVENPGIIRLNLMRAVVAKVTIQPLQRFLIIAFIIAIDNVQAFTGMRMKKLQAVTAIRSGRHFRFGGRATDQTAGENQRQQQKIAKIGS